MSEIDKFEAAKFKPGQSGNPAGKVKGTVGGRIGVQRRPFFDTVSRRDQIPPAFFLREDPRLDFHYLILCSIRSTDCSTKKPIFGRIWAYRTRQRNFYSGTSCFVKRPIFIGVC